MSRASDKTWLDRVLSLFADVRAGEGFIAVLMMANIFLLLICYSVIKTVREPLILLGGGAEVRSYAAAGQALLLMGFVPMYGWFASRVDRVKLLVGATLFFIACIELFALAVAARVPFVGVAFFIWVGIFNMSLVAQFWSFASDIYSKDAGARLFPIIVIGMTAGAPIGSLVAARLFRSGLAPQAILQLSAALLAVSVTLYIVLNARARRQSGTTESALAGSGGFRLVLTNSYLRLVALLIVLLNVVNTTGEYLVARLLSAHVTDLAAANPAFNRQAYIGGFSGDYQFWVNITAFILQALVTSRLVKHANLRGALLALPLIALGGYSIIAAGASFAVVRWIKTAENATDYSIMNTARQMLWLPASREEKYKAKQAIDTFFVRSGDVLSAGVVYVGTAVAHLTVAQFAMANVVLTLAWIATALALLRPRSATTTARRFAGRPLAAAAATLALVVAVAAPARAQESREEELAQKRATKALTLHPYEPPALEHRIEAAEHALMANRPVYAFVGSVFDESGIAVGPGYRGTFADSGAFDAHAALSIRNFKSVDAAVKLPAMMGGHLTASAFGDWLDAPTVSFYGIGNDSSTDTKGTYAYRTTTAGTVTRIQAPGHLAFGAGVASLAVQVDGGADPNYVRSSVYAEYDSRTSPLFTHRGGLYRAEFTDFHQTNAGAAAFTRFDADASHFVPLLRENWVIAMRGSVSVTDTRDGNYVPFYLMPDLGGSHALRGYPSFRFRDRNRMLLTGEYRWTAGPLVDMALFMDAGKVARQFADLGFSDLKTSYGIGASFHTPLSTFLRVEYARTREGSGLVLSFSPTF